MTGKGGKRQQVVQQVKAEMAQVQEGIQAVPFAG